MKKFIVLCLVLSSCVEPESTPIVELEAETETEGSSPEEMFEGWSVVPSTVELSPGLLMCLDIGFVNDLGAFETLAPDEVSAKLLDDSIGEITINEDCETFGLIATKTGQTALEFTARNQTTRIPVAVDDRIVTGWFPDGSLMVGESISINRPDCGLGGCPTYKYGDGRSIRGSNVPLSRVRFETDPAFIEIEDNQIVGISVGQTEIRPWIDIDGVEIEIQPAVWSVATKSDIKNLSIYAFRKPGSEQSEFSIVPGDCVELVVNAAYEDGFGGHFFRETENAELRVDGPMMKRGENEFCATGKGEAKFQACKENVCATKSLPVLLIEEDATLTITATEPVAYVEDETVCLPLAVTFTQGNGESIDVTKNWSSFWLVDNGENNLALIPEVEQAFPKIPKIDDEGSPCFHFSRQDCGFESCLWPIGIEVRYQLLPNLTATTSIQLDERLN